MGKAFPNRILPSPENQTMTLPETVRELYPFASHYYTLPSGHKLHYVDEGEGQAVLFFHGSPTWSFVYRDAIRALRGNMRCLALDNMGCGLSDKPQDFAYTLKNQVSNAIAWVDSLGLKSFDLVIHDWGGPIGMGVAEAYPDRVRKIIVLNSAAFLSKHVPKRIVIFRIPFIGSFLVRGCNLLSLAALRLGVCKPMSAAVREGYLFPYRNWANRIAPYNYVNDVPMRKNHRSWHTLAEIGEGLVRLKEKPMRILWGTHDFCCNPHMLAEWRKRFPDADVTVYPHVGHFLVEDAAAQIIPEMKTFLESGTVA